MSLVAPLLYQLDINRANPGYIPAYGVVTEWDLSLILPNPLLTIQIPRRIRMAIICFHVWMKAVHCEKVNKLDTNELYSRSEPAFRNEKRKVNIYQADQAKAKCGQREENARAYKTDGDCGWKLKTYSRNGKNKD